MHIELVCTCIYVFRFSFCYSSCCKNEIVPGSANLRPPSRYKALRQKQNFQELIQHEPKKSVTKHQQVFKSMKSYDNEVHSLGALGNNDVLANRPFRVQDNSEHPKVSPESIRTLKFPFGFTRAPRHHTSIQDILGGAHDNVIKFGPSSKANEGLKFRRNRHLKMNGNSFSRSESQDFDHSDKYYDQDDIGTFGKVQHMYSAKADLSNPDALFIVPRHLSASEQSHSAVVEAPVDEKPRADQNDTTGHAQGLKGSRLKTSPQYDTTGFWIPSANPLEQRRRNQIWRRRMESEIYIRR